MNSPTLLVGLGGTGSRIVAKVSEMISEEQRRNISCVIFDTDANDIPEIKNHHAEITVVQTSARMTVGEYLANDAHARETWFPVNRPLDRKVLSEGAGQVRSISRLGFESVMRMDGLEPLHKAIDELYKVDSRKADQALRVTIVSSLAGGTGSGLILPVAMYIRHYLETEHQQNANITRGFFILPEVFYGAIPADQKDNLRSNAYASLRELDAFLMKGNKTLSEEYADSVKLEFPVKGSNKYEEYDVSPYDFCFLFDAQNANGEKLNSLEQYMDHAANILYALSVGPVNKRSNSSEDNVIRKLVKEKGRNRYAGAGASRLVYPYQDICELIGLDWASKNISTQWLEYDNRFYARQKEELARREKGYAAEDVDRSHVYKEALINDSINGKPFAVNLVQQVERKSKEGGSDPLYKEYLAALDRALDSGLKQYDPLENPSKKIENLLRIDPDDGVENYKENLEEAVVQLKKMSSAADDYTSSKIKDLSYSLFEASDNEGVTDSDTQILNLIRKDGTYLHPNAVRYFLIMARDEMQEEQETATRNAENEKSSYNTFARNPGRQIPGGEENGNSISDFKPRGLTARKKKAYGFSVLDEVASDIQQQKKTLTDYALNSVKSEVYKKGIAYLNQLISSFDDFYDAFRNQLKLIDIRKDEIYRKYRQAPGMTVRYVAASPDCLDQLVERYPYTGSINTADSGLSKSIVEKVFSFADTGSRKNASIYFGDIFENQILPHYRQEAHDRVAQDLDQGIVKAIELEGNLMLDEEQRDSRAAIDSYVRSVIADTRKLATPFIERPNEITATEIDACAYNTVIKPKRGDESAEAKLILEELVAKGGEDDEDVDKNTIIFFKSYYGLRANSLSKFAPPQRTETYTRNGGEYYTAYMELIKGIRPQSSQYSVQEITPHLDKSWHLAAKMPDLDENSQIIEEYGINAAFFWALVLDLLDVKSESGGLNYYELNSQRVGLDDGDLVADSGEKSSQLRDVLDSFAVQPQIVSGIREYKEKEIRTDTERFGDIRKADIYRKLENIQITKLPETVEKTIKHREISILEIPVLLKTAGFRDMNFDRKPMDLLDVAVRESVQYISGFCSPEELTGILSGFFEEQYDQFIQHISDPDQSWKVSEYDSIVTDTMEKMANLMDENKLNDLARRIRKDADQLKRR